MPIQNWKELQDELQRRQTGIEPVDDVVLSYQDKRRDLDNYINSMSTREGFLSGVEQTNQYIINNPQDYTEEAAELGYGSAKIDKKIPYDIFRLNPDEARAVTQTQVGKLMNGAAKIIPYANTTFLDNTFGLVAGIANIAKDAVDGGEFHPGQSFIDTPFAQQMQEIRDFSEKIFPNYRTQEEIDDADQWWKHLNGNFWGDVFLKNIGFTVGAAASALVGSAGVQRLAGKALRQAYKAALAAEGGEQAAVEAFQKVLQGVRGMNTKKIYDTFESARKAYSRLGWESQLVGGIGGAIGEARVEALSAAREYRDAQAEAANNTYERKKAGLLSDVMANFQSEEDVYDGFGNKIGTRPAISNAGWNYYNEKLAELQQEYNSEMSLAEDEADNVANNTFWFNIPLLTGANIAMFGRMMAGGFKSQAKTALRKKGAEYIGAGTIAGEWGKNVVRASAEGFQELSQKIASEGSKNLSDANIADFHNSKYDANAIKQTSSWISTMMDSASDVISDPQAWEEFAIGMLTGAIAQVPGNGWKAGINQVKANKASAEEMNRRIANPEFKALWEGMVRHNHAENIKDAALNHVITDANGNIVKVGDKFTWKTANDAQIFGDVKMFADSGRLADLEDYVDSFADLTLDDVHKIRTEFVDETDPDFQNKSDAQMLDWVKKRAAEVKKSINQYRDFHEAIDTMSAGTSDPAVLDEMVFTQAMLQNFEDRYNTLLNQVSSRIIPALENVAKEVDKDGNPTARALEAQLRLSYRELLYGLFGGQAIDIQDRGGKVQTSAGEYTPVEIDDKIQEDSLKKLESWGAFANDSKLKQDVIDLQKLVRSRQKYYSNLFDPSFRLKFNENKKTDEDAVNDIKKKADGEKVEEAKKQTANLRTVSDIKQAYLSNDNDGRKKFLEDINLASKDEPAAKDFIKLNDTYNDFRNTLKKYPKIVNKRTGEFNRITGIILDKIFADAENDADLINRLNNFIPSIDDVNTELARLAEAGIISEDEMLPIMVNDMYRSAVNAISDAAKNFKSSFDSTSGRDELKKSDSKTEYKDDNANPQPSAKPDKKDVVKPQEQIPQPQPQAVQPEGSASELSGQVSSDEAASDTNSTYRDDNISENEAYRRDDKGSTKLGYYQQSIPEVPTFVMEEIRKLLSERKNVTDHDQMRAIEQRLTSIKLSNFVEFDEKGNPVGGEVGYADTYKWLEDNGAFEYISTKLKKDDKVVLAIIDGAPKFEGKPQIIVSVVTDRNANGEITNVQPLTVLHALDKSGDYINLDELYDAIYEDYDSTSPDGSLYIFGGKKNPKTSRVFGKRPGIVRYSHDENGGKRVDSIKDYDPDAPIIILGNNLTPVVLRGNVDTSKVYLPNIYPWTKVDNYYGRLYYLVQNGNDTYTPIALSYIPDEVNFDLFNIDGIKQSKKTLEDAIANGKIFSDAMEMRQVGVNFMFDPWDKESGTFKRILPSSPEEKSIPRSDVQNVAADAEIGEKMVAAPLIQKPESFKKAELVAPSAVRSLDEMLGVDEQENKAEVIPEYDDIPESQKANISKAFWDKHKGDKAFRDKILNCHN